MRFLIAVPFLALAAAAPAIVAPAYAADYKPFTQEAFAAAQKAGKPILVDVHAPWCPTCAAQAPILKSLGSDTANEDLIVFKLDFDSQKAEQRPLRVTSQSTLIAFDGETEVGRSIGDTDADSIRALVAKAVG
ncbi:thioredoxin family protein [Pacificimonas sp. WHA3]|uniref:Thioredoxin family protein n=1 Tax=Pacificimonas pallii TaxID=2827236 RepID=A0ABS6SBD7_9SPHN|nr:thioredoxin family protein [Pacificimonas pallii]MBV7255670.1 thioredoxin family protein [Pacificimonas pallii]